MLQAVKYMVGLIETRDHGRYAFPSEGLQAGSLAPSSTIKDFGPVARPRYILN